VSLQRWWGEDSRPTLGQNVGGRLLRRGDTETCAPIRQMSQFGWRLCREIAKSMQTCKNKEIFKMLFFYPFTANRNLISGHAPYLHTHTFMCKTVILFHSSLISLQYSFSPEKGLDVIVHAN
jgi:hypothetical protein